MVEKSGDIALGDAAAEYLAGLPPEGATEISVEIKRFVSWFHAERRMGGLSPLEIAGYSDRFYSNDPERAHKQDILRRFLAQAGKKGWTQSNLAVNLRVRNGRIASASRLRQSAADKSVLTRSGYEDARKELEEFKRQRPGVLDEIRKAAADKDFRENSPLHAAREQLGHIDGRIKELETILKAATIIDQVAGGRACIALGDTVMLRSVDSDRVQCFTIVGPRESNPAGGKISHVSPIGRACIGRICGDVVEVEVPAGKIRYCIEKVGEQD
ncbi:MAG: transcription elongation factor GreA [Dehalococcoidia bacterium]|nr:transcription elongation factor GreA [Dehalococcoidia bacterium]